MTRRLLTELTSRGLMWSGSASGLQIVLNVCSVALLARILSPADYGVSAAAITVITFATMACQIGIGPTIVQRSEFTSAHLSAATILALAAALVGTVAMWLSGPAVASALQIDELAQAVPVLAPLLLVQNFNMLSESVLSRDLRFKTIALINLLGWVFGTFCIAIPLALSGMKYWSLIFAYMAQAGFMAVAYGRYGSRFLARPSLSWQVMREIASTSMGFFWVRMLNYVAMHADNMIVARWFGPASLGVYSRTYYLISLPANLFDRVTRSVVFPVMSQVQDDRERLRSAFLKSVSLTAMASIPASVFLMVFAGEVVGVVLGSQWSLAVTPFVVFSSALYFRTTYKSCSLVLMAQGRSHLMVALHAVYAVAVVAGVMFAARFGLVAACLAAVLSVVLIYLMYAAISCRIAAVTLAQFLALHARAVLHGLWIAAIGLAVKAATAGAPAFLTLSVGAAAVLLPLALVAFLYPSLVLGQDVLVVLRSFRGPGYRPAE